MTVSTVFLLLLIYSVGTAWAAFLPHESSVKGTRFSPLAPIIRFINPGPFGLKEVSLISPVALRELSPSHTTNVLARRRIPGCVHRR